MPRTYADLIYVSLTPLSTPWGLGAESEEFLTRSKGLIKALHGFYPLPRAEDPLICTSNGKLTLLFAIGLVLQKQLPSSQVPRFNPHPPQAPPKPRKKEFVSNAYSPSKVSFFKNVTDNAASNWPSLN